MRFEDSEFYVWSGYDKILRDSYGDFMQLPPADKRKEHYPDVLDFGEYANI